MLCDPLKGVNVRTAQKTAPPAVQLAGPFCFGSGGGLAAPAALSCLVLSLIEATFPSVVLEER